jgi:hypothetical protein
LGRVESPDLEEQREFAPRQADAAAVAAATVGRLRWRAAQDAAAAAAADEQAGRLRRSLWIASLGLSASYIAEPIPPPRPAPVAAASTAATWADLA